MALNVNDLKERLATERDLMKLWHSFMDLTQEPEFQSRQRPCNDQALYDRIAEITAKLASQLPLKGSLTVALFEVPPYDLIHGPLTTSSGIGNIFYFRESDSGLIALPSGTSAQSSQQWTMARFSIGQPLAKAAASSSIH